MHVSLIRVSIVALFTLAACTTSEDPDCDGHGTFVHGHCHCEAGYQVTEDEQGCVVRPPQQPPEEQLLAFTASKTKAFTALDEGARVWVLEAVGGGSLLRVEVYAAFGGPTAPGAYGLTAKETSYATCGICVLYETGCTAHGDHYHCDRTFMPRAEGAVSFSALGLAGTKLTGDLAGLRLQEVAIADDLATTPVGSGAVLRLDAWMFDVLLADAP